MDRCITPILLILTLAACTGGRGGPAASRPPIEDAFVFETAFGGEAAGEEFMLVRPQGLAVDNDGNVMVVDEDYVKVFSPDGEPLTRMGGTGEGPGELSRPREIWYSPSGYFTVFGGNFGFTANYFRPDRSYLERVFYMSDPPYTDILAAEGLRGQRPEYVFALGEEERVYSIDSRLLDGDFQSPQSVYLFHEQADSVRTLAHYEQTSSIRGPRMGYGFPFLGMLQVALLPERRIAWSHGFHDSDREVDPPTYTIHILGLDSGARSEIVHTYEPQPIDYETREVSESLRERNPQQAEAQEELNRITARVMAERAFKVPITGLMTDGDFLFAFTTKPRRELTEAEREAGEIGTVLVDVFDSRHLTYVASAWLPPPGRMAIRDGCLYMPWNLFSADQAPEIRKYRIVPEVYGR